MVDTSILFENILERLKRGDLHARDELVGRVAGRLIVLARRMLRRSPRVARWEEVEDLVQQALIRLHRCLDSVVPVMVEDFLQLGAQQLRRELCDMARHYFGPLGQGANHDSHATKLLQYTAPHRGREPFNSNSGLQKLAT